MIDLSKLRKGDRVKFRCGGESEVTSINQGKPNQSLDDGGFWLEFNATGVGGFSYYSDGRWSRHTVQPFDIIEVIPKPFDWSEVKPGMAFRIKNDTRNLCFYIGPAIQFGKPLSPAIASGVYFDTHEGIYEWKGTYLDRDEQCDIQL